jgi:hypothetical protein
VPHYKPSHRSRYPGQAPIPIQAPRRPGVDPPGVNKFTCSSCAIDYPVPEGRKPLCPLCDALKQMESLRQQILALGQERDLLEGDLVRARREANVVATMRDALSIADPVDAAEIKAIAYRWRADPGLVAVSPVRLQVDESSKRRLAIQVQVRGGGDPSTEFFVPTSVGGVVFAESYEELVKARGAVEAMKQYAQAIAGKLAS